MKTYLLMVNIFNKPETIEYSWWLNNKPYLKYPNYTFGSVHTHYSKLED